METVVKVARTTSFVERSIEEDLIDDQVVVERIPVGMPIDAMPPIREEGDTTIIPVVEEILVTERRLFLKEEVRIRQVRSSRRHVETVTLREQNVTVARSPRSRVPASIGTKAVNRQQPTEDAMNDETIVAVYDTPAHAEMAANDLKAANVPAGAISLHASSGTGFSGADADRSETGTRPVREKGFWSGLFGGEPDHDTTVYERSVESGSTVVTVRATEANAPQVMQILESHHPIDIDERASVYGMGSSTTTTAMPVQEPMITTRPTAAPAVPTPASTGRDESLQLSAEELVVGKRLVNRGGTRVRRFVVETPVEQDVTLHDERVVVERRPVTDGRAVSDADFSDKTLEMTESHEEAVVSKTARVVEEVSLHKEGVDRVETVHDMVRREDVEIEKIPSERRAGEPIDPAPTKKI